MKKPLGQYGPAGVQDTTAAAPAAADEDDDDIDLFGSDEEEVNTVAGLMVCVDPTTWSHDDFLTIFRLMLWWTPFVSESQLVEKCPGSCCMFVHSLHTWLIIYFLAGWGIQKNQGGEACSIQRKEGKKYVFVVF